MTSRSSVTEATVEPEVERGHATGDYQDRRTDVDVDVDGTWSYKTTNLGLRPPIVRQDPHSIRSLGRSSGRHDDETSENVIASGAHEMYIDNEHAPVRMPVSAAAITAYNIYAIVNKTTRGIRIFISRPVLQQNKGWCQVLRADVAQAAMCIHSLGRHLNDIAWNSTRRTEERQAQTKQELGRNGPCDSPVNITDGASKVHHRIRQKHTAESF